MSLLSRLLGSKPSETPEAKPEEYEGFAIYPEPVKDGGRWRIAARIEKEVGGEIKQHQLIRADVVESHDEACSMSLRKARQMIDEQGESIFR
ncbi:HlyU family transcriptional regulator [Solirhodobacter olei]|uniref:HlyU family transcriptional regulator n=1 Tax=Solirhodobacter olei TaxID=2493082 RepID=UPI000FD7EC26|nr:HlyU family transcriptional regulator [Solirhodobacter olei]